MKFGKRLMTILMVLAMALAGLACDGSVPAKEPERGPSEEQTQITDSTLLSSIQGSSDLKAKLLSDLKKDAGLADLTSEELEAALTAVMQDNANATVADLKAHIIAQRRQQNQPEAYTDATAASSLSRQQRNSLAESLFISPALLDKFIGDLLLVSPNATVADLKARLKEERTGFEGTRILAGILDDTSYAAELSLDELLIRLGKTANEIRAWSDAHPNATVTDLKADLKPELLKSYSDSDALSAVLTDDSKRDGAYLYLLRFDLEATEQEFEDYLASRDSSALTVQAVRKWFKDPSYSDSDALSNLGRAAKAKILEGLGITADDFAAFIAGNPDATVGDLKAEYGEDDNGGRQEQGQEQMTDVTAITAGNKAAAAVAAECTEQAVEEYLAWVAGDAGRTATLGGLKEWLANPPQGGQQNSFESYSVTLQNVIVRTNPNEDFIDEYERTRSKSLKDKIEAAGLNYCVPLEIWKADIEITIASQEDKEAYEAWKAELDAAIPAESRRLSDDYVIADPDATSRAAAWEAAIVADVDSDVNGKLKELPSSLAYSQKQNTEFLDSVVFRDAYYDKIRQYVWSGETGDGTNPDDVLVIFGKYNAKTNNADKDSITDALIRKFEGNTADPEDFYGQPAYKNPQAVRYVQEKGKPMLWWDDAFDNDHRHGKRLRSVVDVLDPYLPAAITQKETEEADQLALVKEYKECCKEMREWLRRQADRAVQGGTSWEYLKDGDGDWTYFCTFGYYNDERSVYSVRMETNSNKTTTLTDTEKEDPHRQMDIYKSKTLTQVPSEVQSGQLEAVTSETIGNRYNPIATYVQHNYHPDEQGLDLARPRIIQYAIGSNNWSNDYYDTDSLMKSNTTTSTKFISYLGRNYYFSMENAFSWAYREKCNKYNIENLLN